MPSNLPTPTIAVVGSRHSGKTTTIETIIKGLAKKHYKIATAKHIHQTDFTIDTKGRDTWRHTQAGAHITTAVATNELTTIEKTNTTKLSLRDITKKCENNTDIIIVEGFRNLVAQDLTIPKIVTVKSKQEIEEALQVFKPILAFTGLVSETPKDIKIPLINIKKEPDKLIDIIDKQVRPIIQKRQETKNALSHPSKQTEITKNTKKAHKITDNNAELHRITEKHQIDEHTRKGHWGLENGSKERKESTRKTHQVPRACASPNLSNPSTKPF